MKVVPGEMDPMAFGGDTIGLVYLLKDDGMAAVADVRSVNGEAKEHHVRLSLASLIGYQASYYLHT